MQLTDAQLLTAVIAFVIPISALIHSNTRITDARTALHNEIESTKETLRAEIQSLRQEMLAGFARIEAALKAHELEHHR